MTSRACAGWVRTRLRRCCLLRKERRGGPAGPLRPESAEELRAGSVASGARRAMVAAGGGWRGSAAAGGAGAGTVAALTPAGPAADMKQEPLPRSTAAAAAAAAAGSRQGGWGSAGGGLPQPQPCPAPASAAREAATGGRTGRRARSQNR